VIPRNQTLWAGHPGFIQDASGTWFLTIGAESSSNDCGGDLVSDLNRSSDLNPDIAIYRERLSYPLGQEDEIIRGLLSADANYTDDLPYACRPSFNDLSYNSNSYSHGMLDVVGIAPPLPPFLLPYLHWGWRKPVPAEEFLAR
jgi:hypothetical protein